MIITYSGIGSLSLLLQEIKWESDKDEIEQSESTSEE